MKLLPKQKSINQFLARSNPSNSSNSSLPSPSSSSLLSIKIEPSPARELGSSTPVQTETLSSILSKSTQRENSNDLPLEKLRKRAIEEKLALIEIHSKMREKDLRELLFLQSPGDVNITEFDPLSPLLQESLSSYNQAHEKSLIPLSDDVSTILRLAGCVRQIRDGPLLYSSSMDIFAESSTRVEPPPSSLQPSLPNLTTIEALPEPKKKSSLPKSSSSSSSSSLIQTTLQFSPRPTNTSPSNLLAITSPSNYSNSSSSVPPSLSSSSVGTPLSSKALMITRNKKPKISASELLNRRPSLSRKASSKNDLLAASCIRKTVDEALELVVLPDDSIQREASSLRSIFQLQSQGLWGSKQVARQIEPPRNKCHWDFLLEEMAWMSNDFRRERKWKMDAARKISKAVLKYFRDLEAKEEMNSKKESADLRRIASNLARQVKKFWIQIGKVKQHCDSVAAEEEKKKALEEKLNLIVGETEQLAKDLTVEFQKDEPSSQAEFLDSHPEDHDFVHEEQKDDETSLFEGGDGGSGDEAHVLHHESTLPIESVLEKYKGYLDHNTESSDSSSSNEASSDANSDSSEEEGNGESLRLLLETDAEPVQEDEGKKIMAQFAESANEAQPTGFTLSTTKVKTPVPFLLKHKLREYQHIGLDWLVTMHDKGLNGILADEMGLGKTIITISLLSYLACSRGEWGCHLIIVPTSVMLNWEMELKKWCPALKILTYYGSQKERRAKRVGWSKKNTFHVCITSYKLVVQDQIIFRRKKWNYLILDEAQHIKNFQSQRWQVLLNFKASHRILLTGTPLQNNLMELWSLMHFLMPQVFRSHSEFKEWFCRPVNGMLDGSEKFDSDLVARLHSILRPFLLRRLKSDVEQQLPPKYEHVLLCPLSKRQRLLYDEFISCRSTVDVLSSSNYLGMMNILMQLRKVCNHPDLFEVRPIISSFDQPVSLSFTAHSICCDILESSSISETLRFFGLQFTHLLEEWSTEVSNYLPHYQATPEQILSPSSFPSSSSQLTHVISEPKSLLEWKSYLSQVELAQERLRSIHVSYVNRIRCSTPPVNIGWNLRSLLCVVVPSRDVHRIADNPRNFLSFSSKLLNLVKLPSARASEMRPILEEYSFVIPRVRASCPELTSVHPISSANRRNFMMESLSSKASEIILRDDVLRVSQIRQTLYFPDKRLIQFDCGKLQKLAELLRDLKSKGSRALIFTQMSRVLDILETFLNIHGHTYFRLDGTTKIEQRQVLMERFNNDPRIFLFILSTRSGGVGINLTGADSVIFYDSDWNPAMDAQAQDRCHRIGQTRDVHIYRLISERTIEENILKKAQQKKLLDAVVIQDGQFTTDFFAQIDLRTFFGENVASTQSSDVRVSRKDFELAARSVEDKEDIIALEQIEKELNLDLEEFDEPLPVAVSSDPAVESAAPLIESDHQALPQDSSTPASSQRVETSSPFENQSSSTAAQSNSEAIETQLNPIQRYALRYLQKQSEAVGLDDAVVLQEEFLERETHFEQYRANENEEDGRVQLEEETLFYEVGKALSTFY